MSVFKIYSQINNFADTDHKIKVYVYALPPYPWEPTGNPASH